MNKDSKMMFVQRCAAMALLVIVVPLAGCQSLGANSALSLASEPPGIAEVSGGKEQFRAGNFGLAEAAFKRAVELAPQNGEAWLGLAACHDELRRFDLADRDYAQVQAVSGTSVALLNNRGYSQFLRGNLAAARADLSAARALSPDNAAVQINLKALAAPRQR
jgi:Flp pilus assembly protein TadD